MQFKVHSDLGSRSGVSLGTSLDHGEDKRRPSVHQRKEVLFDDRDKAAPHLGGIIPPKKTSILGSE